MRPLGSGGTLAQHTGAALYERLGEPEQARAIADAVLEHCLQPLTRIEALRLRARTARSAAAAALERAADEAAHAGYVWLEVMAARELLELGDDAGAAEAGARARLREAFRKLRADDQTMNDFCEESGAAPINWRALASA